MKMIRFLAIIVVSAIVAGVVVFMVEAMEIFSYHWSFVAVYCGSAIGVAALLGAFDEEHKQKAHYENIKHRIGLKDAA